MKYAEFREKVKDLPVISSPFLALLAGGDRSFLVQFRRWVKAKKIIKLRKGLYLLGQADRRINPSRSFIAGELYAPSYVSLEYAMSLHGLIPEKVVELTCITTKKTTRYKNSLGRFVYQHVQERCFTGFQELRDEANLPYFLALPEKAIVDFIYLNQSRFKANYSQELFGSLRLQNIKTLNKKRLLAYAELFNNQKLIKIIQILLRGDKHE